MTTFDIIFLVAIAAGLVLGAWKGLIKQILALAGVLVITIGTTYLAPYVSKWFESAIPQEGTRSFVAMGVAAVIIAVVYGIITSLISKAVNKTPVLGKLNRVLGAVFSIAVVYMICSVLVALMYSTAEDFLPKVKSTVKPILDESWVVNKIYGGAENPDRNFFGNWLMRTFQEKVMEFFPQVPAEQPQ